MKLTRREAMGRMAAGAVFAAAGGLWSRELRAAAPAPATGGPFALPPLPYAPEALEPHIDARTMTIHHGKHHAAYVAKLNEAVAGYPDLAAKPVDDLVRGLSSVPEAIRTAVRNHGGGHANHTLFWATLAPGGGGEPGGALADAVKKAFGGFAGLKEQLSKAAMGQFGSGWAWLSLAADRTLTVEATANQDSPLSAGRTPLFGIDVWEHAYYLKYQNRRADYVAAIFNVIDWTAVAERYAKAK